MNYEDLGLNKFLNFAGLGSSSNAYEDRGSVKNTIIKDQSINDAKIDSLNANKITAGTIDATNIAVVNLSASNITTGTLSADLITGGSINANNIDLYNLNASNITAGSISANYLSSGTINADSINVTNINGENIKGTTIEGSSIKSTEVDARILKDDAVETDKIKAGAVTADKITVGTISAISANLGTVTSGLVSGCTVRSTSGDSRVQLTSGDKIEFYSGGTREAYIQGHTSGAQMVGQLSCDSLHVGDSSSAVDTDDIKADGKITANSGIYTDDIYDRSQGYVECHDGFYVSDWISTNSTLEVGGDIDMNSNDINEIGELNYSCKIYKGSEDLSKVLSSIQNSGAKKKGKNYEEGWEELDHSKVSEVIKARWKSKHLNKETGKMEEVDKEGYSLNKLVMVQNKMIIDLSTRLDDLEVIVTNLLKAKYNNSGKGDII